MTAEDALKLLLSKLEECEIPYMITGSFASYKEEALLKDQKIALPSSDYRTCV